MTATPYTNDHVAVLKKFAQQSDELVRKAGAWSDQLAAAKVEATTAEDSFLVDFSRENAARLADAQNRVRDLTLAVAAVENSGGPDAVRSRALRADAVFEVFEKAFSERITALDKLVPPIRKQLAARIGELTEIGVGPSWIELDPNVSGLRGYHQAVADAAEYARACRNYAGIGGHGELKTFETLFAALTTAFPTAPAASTPAAAWGAVARAHGGAANATA